MTARLAAWIAAISLLVSLGANGAMLALWIEVRAEAQRGEEAHTANCALRGDLKKRYEANLDLLAQPGRKGLGRLNATIVSNNINDQQSALAVLNVLHCSNG